MVVVCALETDKSWQVFIFFRQDLHKVLGKGWPSDDIGDILSPRMRHQFLKAYRNLAKRYGSHELSYQRYTNIPRSNSENSSPIIARNEYIALQ